MKKVFLLFAAAALTLAACNKPQYVIPIDTDDEEEKPGGDDQDPGYKEKTFVVNVTLKEGVNNNYSGTVGIMPGNEILAFLDMTQEEFYKGMGTCTTGSLTTAQSDNTVMFGVADKNSTEELKWVPSTTNNFGHWFGKDGALITWGDEAYFFTESLTEWGLDAPDADVLSGMWNYTVGCFPDRTVAKDSFKATEVFFVTNDEDVELYAYVQWNITIEEAEEVSLNVVATQELTYDSPFYNDYTHTSLVDDIDMAALSAAIGIDYTEADVYGVNADGSFSLAPGKNWWFKVDGTIASWGAGAGICINDDANTNSWAWCMYPDENLSGQTCYGAFAFVNPTTLNAYVVKVTVNIGAQDTWAVTATLQVAGETVETYPDFAPVAAYLGFESVDGLYEALCDGSVYPVGVNADGSLFLGEDGNPDYSQANWYNADWNVYARGVFFSKTGFGSHWASGDDHFYSTIYWYPDGDNKVIEVDITPFDPLTEEDPGYYTYKWGFVKGDKMANLEMQITLESAVAWNDVTVEGTTATIKMVPKGGYKGFTVTFDNAAIADALGTENLAAEIESGDIVVVGLNQDGTVAMNPNDNTKYWNSGETPYGHWFDADGSVCSWGSDARVCCNIKTNGSTVYTAMCQMDDNGGSTCAVGDTYKLVQRFMKGDKSVDITYNISIVEAI